MGRFLFFRRESDATSKARKHRKPEDCWGVERAVQGASNQVARGCVQVASVEILVCLRILSKNKVEHQRRILCLYIEFYMASQYGESRGVLCFKNSLNLACFFILYLFYI